MLFKLHNYKTNVTVEVIDEPEINRSCKNFESLLNDSGSTQIPLSDQKQSQKMNQISVLDLTPNDTYDPNTSQSSSDDNDQYIGINQVDFNSQSLPYLHTSNNITTMVSSFDDIKQIVLTNLSKAINFHKALMTNIQNCLDIRLQLMYEEIDRKSKYVKSIQALRSSHPDVSHLVYHYDTKSHDFYYTFKSINFDRRILRNIKKALPKTYSASVFDDTQQPKDLISGSLKDVIQKASTYEKNRIKEQMKKQFNHDFIESYLEILEKLKSIWDNAIKIKKEDGYYLIGEDEYIQLGSLDKMRCSGYSLVTSDNYTYDLHMLNNLHDHGNNAHINPNDFRKSMTDNISYGTKEQAVTHYQNRINNIQNSLSNLIRYDENSYIVCNDIAQFINEVENKNIDNDIANFLKEFSNEDQTNDTNDINQPCTVNIEGFSVTIYRLNKSNNIQNYGLQVEYNRLQNDYFYTQQCRLKLCIGVEDLYKTLYKYRQEYEKELITIKERFS